MYFIVVATGYCAAYIGLSFLFPKFFPARAPIAPLRVVRALVLLTTLLTAVFIASVSVPDVQLGNRILHMFGGGFLAWITCFLVMRDRQVRMGRFAFFVFAILIVTFLGVANEILEFVLQTYTPIVFSANPYDTWFDLTSNTIGALLAGAVTVPLIRRHPARRRPVAPRNVRPSVS